MINKNGHSSDQRINNRNRKQMGSRVYTIQGCHSHNDKKQLQSGTERLIVLYTYRLEKLILYMNVQNALQDRQVYKEKLMGLKFGSLTAFIN